MPDNDPENTEIAETIQQTASDDDELDGAVLVGYVMIAEWVDPSGERWLSQRTWSPSGPPPMWTVKGWLHEQLYSGFSTGDE